MNTNHNLEPVVAVCGNEARIYGPVGEKNIRPLWKIKTFPHHGAAKFFAQEFEEQNKIKKP